ncbi:hypothetical protein ELS19_12455 [Halogeometricum borinquense]|uniref:Uncharacterized protein n=1 Tax=Halogeometricum borinquense TaxID=60847 RepID=A0A482TD60_9EURY|nr:hypothetical protein [Halogeometricum borinquense]RYJ14682.1 hypothetical protein ELS19_12455 [Halogeometricum borinquense]
MSTHTRHATEPKPTPETTTTAHPPNSAERSGSWVAQCQSQFDAGRTDRLHNLADEENHAMPDGV